MLSSMTEENMADIDIDYLIVGAGPAGASLACFLGRYGCPPSHRISCCQNVLMISRSQRFDDKFCTIHCTYSKSSRHQSTYDG